MTEHEKLLNLTAEEIAALSAKAFEELLDRIRAGEDPQTAIKAIMDSFDAGYYAVLSVAFSQTLADFVGTAALKDYIVGEVTLSENLYQNAQKTSLIVQEIIKRHAAGYQDARKLLLEIYEGYGFKIKAGEADDPLTWKKGSDKWPKFMRDVINADKSTFDKYLEIAKKAAEGNKSPSLKAAYLEALEALENGAGDKALAKKLDVAFQERMRYHADRIAQTELHRLHSEQQAREILEDDTIEAVKFVMSATHPRRDICDVYAFQDKFGLGKGIYPKEHAPKLPLHPFCRCVLHSRRSIKTANSIENAESERQFLARVMRDEGEQAAANLVGGRGKLQAILDGDGILDVLNANKPDAYKLGTIG